ncbi:PVC-type heme-binding CxxCH protein [Pleomorphovibrio marinus]|uniref:PVC-type heme-binding CxxCH protein n=1 Tax=Pleomorphovibrio marinus TaxID=2164132 RepID=UPI000E0A3363|nr:PVC-type heme-binding CxxCH protein [Pleomorphovibrio marinus]
MKCQRLLYLLMLNFACSTQERQEPALLFVPDDLEVTLWAESPDFYNPTNIDVDHRGRVWVTEAVNYRDFRNSDGHMVHENGDRVMILEDSNGDGKADKSKVFVQDADLRSPLGIAVVGNQVIVSCAPHILIYTDENGDDLPDKKEIFLTGFGGRDHDHGLHAGVMGPDDKWYFIVGNAGPHEVQDKDGWTLRSGSVYNEYTPYAQENIPNQKSDDGNVYTGGLVIRVNPDGTGMEVLSHNYRNAFEVAVDSFGNMWHSDNDDQTASCRTTWLMEGSNAGFFSATGERTWQADRRPGQTVPLAHWHQYDPGVLPAGDIYGAGSPTGIVRIEGDELGESYRGMLLSADAGRNIIFGYHPKLKGAGFPLNQREAFISSVQIDNTNYIWHEVEEDDSKWFRPSDIAVGTEGALYVADWYDPIVGGHRMMDKVGHGKIYKIHPKSKKLSAPNLEFGHLDGLIAALKNPAIHVRAQARKKLLEKGAEAIPSLINLLEDPNPFFKARSIWLLAALGQIETVSSYLSHQNPALALTAYRALSQQDASNLLQYAQQALSSSHPILKAEVAISLRDHSWELSKPLFFSIIDDFDGEDPWLLHALGIGLKAHREIVYPLLLNHFDTNNPEKWPISLSKLVWELHPTPSARDLAVRINSSHLSQEERMESMTALAFIPTQEAADLMRGYYENSDLSRQSMAQWWLQFRKTNEWSAYLGDWESPTAQLPTEEPELLTQKEVLLDTTSTESTRESAIQFLASSTQGRLHLVQLAIGEKLSKEEKERAAEELHAEISLPVKSLLAHHFPIHPSRKLEEARVVKVKASKEEGKILAIRHCGVCHSVGEIENEIGPDLRQIHQKFSRKGLIEAILEPDAAVGFGSETYLVELENGAILYGMLLSSGPVVTVLESNGKRHLVPAEKIKQRKQLRHSLMPDPAWMDLSETEIAHIAAYLMGV